MWISTVKQSMNPQQAYDVNMDEQSKSLQCQEGTYKIKSPYGWINYVATYMNPP